MKITVVSSGGTAFTADSKHQEPAVREALDREARGEAKAVARAVRDYADTELRGMVHDCYAFVSEDDETTLWSGRLDRRLHGNPEVPAAGENRIRELEEALAPAREALAAIALGTAADPSVTADKALTVIAAALAAGSGTKPAPGDSAGPGIPVRLLQRYLCDPCLDGEGAECHTPGCSLWMHPAPGRPVRESQGVTILGTLQEGTGR